MYTLLTYIVEGRSPTYASYADDATLVFATDIYGKPNWEVSREFALVHDTSAKITRQVETESIIFSIEKKLLMKHSGGLNARFNAPFYVKVPINFNLNFEL